MSSHGATRRGKAFNDDGPPEMAAPFALYQQSRCAGKVAYSTRAHAVRAKKVLGRRHGKVFAAYRCDFCGKWHLCTRDSSRDWS